jgi:hypothetical protein
MPLNNSTNIVFTPGSFTSSGPLGGSLGITNLELSNVSNVKWANKTRQINLGNTNYGYVTIDISYTVTGTVDAVGLSLTNNETLLSYSNTLSGLFTPLLPGEYIKLKAGVTTRLYITVNDKIKSQFLPVTICLARKGTLPSNVTINLQYNCTDVGPLY